MGLVVSSFMTKIVSIIWVYILLAILVIPMYVDNSSKIVGGRQGSSELTFDVVDDTISGTAKFVFMEQGWKVKLPADISGSVSGDELNLQTSEVSMKYEGVSHTMHIKANAKKVGDTYIGEKVVVVDGKEHVLPFNAKNVG